ncbi:hypothetical protein Tco_1381646 [Tanacetum coccineum]
MPGKRFGGVSEPYPYPRRFQTGTAAQQAFPCNRVFATSKDLGDVMDFGMEEIIPNRKIENEIEEKGNENDMAILDNESCDESSEEGTESEEEGNEVKDYVGLELRAEDDGGRKMEKDEESRFSGISRVCETPEVEITKKEEKSAKLAVDVDKTPREETCGEKENKEKRITCEKKLDTQDRTFRLTRAVILQVK